MSRSARFEALVIPHLDAACNLARWLLRDATAADDAVQEASLRAWRHIEGLRSGDARPWFLAIVRNVCMDQLGRIRADLADFDSEAFLEAVAAPPAADPAVRFEMAAMKIRVDAAILALSPPLREVVVLRELEGLDYAEIARIVGIPMGTVMSRLSRARERLREALSDIRAGGDR